MKYEILENGHGFEIIEAESASEALKRVNAPDGSDYGSGRSTTWVEWHAVAVDDVDDRDSRTFKLDPDEPSCTADNDHKWIDGPVRGGAGAGIIFTDECEYCEARRSTDTWATNPADGTQGHTTITYLDAD